MRHEKPHALLLIGGGRWARVYLSILAELDIPFSDVIVVSSHGGDRLAEAIAHANRRPSPRFAIVGNMDSALQGRPIAAAIVANAARDHAPVTLALLLRNIAVLVEKPVALSTREADQLADAARESRTFLMPGHVLRHCEYLRNFAAALPRQPGAIASISLEWRDMTGETRHGEAKSYDPGLGVVEDVGPHIATILSKVIGGAPGKIETANIERGGLAVAAQGSWNEIPLTLALEREGTNRIRRMVLKTRGSGNMILDFTREPGTISVDGFARDADPDWRQRASPLILQLQDFFAKAANGPQTRALEDIQMVTDFTAGLAQAVRAAQKDWLASSSWPMANLDQKTVAMRELIAPLLIEAGFWHSGKRDQLGTLARQAVALAERSPGISLTDIVVSIGANGGV